MSTEVGLLPFRKREAIRGFTPLFRKESQGWWGTRRWWINALLWMVVIDGLAANMLFVPTVASLASPEEISQAGGLTAHILSMGLSVLFEFGSMITAVGAVVLALDTFISERENGTAAWLLSKPASRRSYVLAKMAANLISVLLVLNGLPLLIGYGMLSIRLGHCYPVLPFAAGAGLMVLHTMFYLMFTLMLGIFFRTRMPILGIALGSALGGSLIGGLVRPLLYVTPWMLPKYASLAASARFEVISDGISAILATALLCATFIWAALSKFERIDL